MTNQPQVNICSTNPHHFVWTWPIEDDAHGSIGVCDLCGAVTTAERDARLLEAARAEGDGAIHDAYALAYDRGRTEALLEAARYFEYEMAPAWGGEARWISAGGHVADLVGCILRERATELAETTDTEETP